MPIRDLEGSLATTVPGFKIFLNSSPQADNANPGSVGNFLEKKMLNAARNRQSHLLRLTFDSETSSHEEIRNLSGEQFIGGYDYLTIANIKGRSADFSRNYVYFVGGRLLFAFDAAVE